MNEEAKDITLNEMILRLREKGAVSVGHSALDVWLRKRGSTSKTAAHALEQERTDLLKRRQNWFDGQLGPERHQNEGDAFGTKPRQQRGGEQSGADRRGYQSERQVKAQDYGQVNRIDAIDIGGCLS